MKILRVILWIIIFIIIFLGILYLFSGALEWFPTPKQQEKAHITSIVMMVIPAICCVTLFLTRKNKKIRFIERVLFQSRYQKKDIRKDVLFIVFPSCYFCGCGL